MFEGVDAGSDVDSTVLTAIYNRIKESQFAPGEDHVTQVMRVEQMLIGKKPVGFHVIVYITWKHNKRVIVTALLTGAHFAKNYLQKFAERTVSVVDTYINISLCYRS